MPSFFARKRLFVRNFNKKVYFLNKMSYNNIVM